MIGLSATRGTAYWLSRLAVGRSPLRTLRRAALLAVCCVVVFRFVLRPAWTEGQSMEPAVRHHRLHFVNLLAYRWGTPSRGDIVAIRGAGNTLVYLKRLIGLPGETIAFDQGQLQVNGQPHDEPYVVFKGAWSRPAVRLGADEYYVAGDNRDLTWEQHVAGTVRRRDLAGELLW